MRSALIYLTLACGFSVVFAQPLVPNAASRTISIDVVAEPKSGLPATGLTQSDFAVFDNKVERPITSFRAIAGEQSPVQILLLVDAVNADYSAMAFERQQIDAFLKSNGGHLSHPVSLAIFTDAGTQIPDGPTTDGNQLSALLDRTVTGLRDIRRDTIDGGADRFNLSIQALQSIAATPAPSPGRTIIFWISPGWPLLSGPSVNLDFAQQKQIFAHVVGLSTLLRRNNITLYSIDPLGTEQSLVWQSAYEQFVDGVKKPGQVNLGNLALQVIALQSGGLALGANNDTASQLRRCMSDTTAYYRITYDAPAAEHADEYHAISVKLSTPGLTARTRTGYYAQP